MGVGETEVGEMAPIHNTVFCSFPPSQMGSTAHLSRFALTKIITISPFYLLYNKTKVGGGKGWGLDL